MWWLERLGVKHMTSFWCRLLLESLAHLTSTHVDHLIIYLGFEVKPHTLHFRVNTSHMFSRTLLTVKSNGQVVCQPNPSRSSHGSWLVPASLWRASIALVSNTNNCSCHWPWPYGAVVLTWPAMSFCNKQCPWPYNGSHLTLECKKPIVNCKLDMQYTSNFRDLRFEMYTYPFIKLSLSHAEWKVHASQEARNWSNLKFNIYNIGWLRSTMVGLQASKI